MMNLLIIIMQIALLRIVLVYREKLLFVSISEKSVVYPAPSLSTLFLKTESVTEPELRLASGKSL